MLRRMGFSSSEALVEFVRIRPQMHGEMLAQRKTDRMAVFRRQVLTGGMSGSLEAKIMANQHRPRCRAGEEFFPKAILVVASNAGAAGARLIWLNEALEDLPYQSVTMPDRNYDALALKWHCTVCSVLTARVLRVRRGQEAEGRKITPSSANSPSETLTRM